MTARNAFKEDPRFHDRNQAGERVLRTSPATLADGRDGVAIFLGRYSICLSNDGAYKLAESIIHTLELNRKGNNK